jgi:threonine dehydratase
VELVKKETIRKAVFLLWDKEKLVVEGEGAVSIAAIMENKGLFMGKEVVAVISGGNIEDKLFRSILVSETIEA